MSKPDQALPYPGITKYLSRFAKQDGDLDIGRALSRDPARLSAMSIEAAGWRLDYSRQLLSRGSADALLKLADQSEVLGAREALFDGRPLNNTEDRAVLHTLLRSSATQPGLEEECRAIQDCLARMTEWVKRVHDGNHCGHSGQTITDVVNLGIGGSDLGPRMVVEALRPWHVEQCRVHFSSNVDPDDLAPTVANLDPARTLFIVCSKTLRTEETLYNARQARRWLLEGGVPEAQLAQHFLAVSTNLEAARELGIPPENILPMWDWVGGRYSLWSAIGWSIAFAIGMDSFLELLGGAEAMDLHFHKAPAEENMPLWLSLLEIWYVNYMGSQNHAVIPYHQDLARLPAFLQQLSMESNGKRVNRYGDPVDYSTAPVLWGDVGTNGQHSFHQLLHQGTLMCPVDFIVFTGEKETREGKQRLLANGLSQMRALMLGRDEAQSRDSLQRRGYDPKQAAELAPHLVIPGNRPSSTLSCAQLTPAALGALLALYEHKTFCSGHIWQINSFDQWGVELGKEMGAEIYGAISGETKPFDPSTNAMLELTRD